MKRSTGSRYGCKIAPFGLTPPPKDDLADPFHSLHIGCSILLRMTSSTVVYFVYSRDMNCFGESVCSNTMPILTAELALGTESEQETKESKVSLVTQFSNKGWLVLPATLSHHLTLLSMLTVATQQVLHKPMEET